VSQQQPDQPDIAAWADNCYQESISPGSVYVYVWWALLFRSLHVWPSF